MDKALRTTDLNKLTDIELIKLVQTPIVKMKAKESVTRIEDRNAQTAKWVLLQKYNRLIMSAAARNRLFSDFSATVEKEDLIAEVQIGFMEAVERYNTDIPSALGVFASPYINDRLKRYLRINAHLVSPTKSTKMREAFNLIIQMKDNPQEEVYAALRAKGNISDFEISQLFETLSNKNNHNTVWGDASELGESSVDISSDDCPVRDEFMGDAFKAEDELLNSQRHKALKQVFDNVFAMINPHVAEAFMMSKGLHSDLSESEETYTLADLTEFLADRGITGDKNPKMTPQNLCLIFKKIERLMREEMDEMFEVKSLSELVA